MITREQFNALWAGVFASSEWAEATPAQRLDHVEDTFRNVPVVWDLIKDWALETLFTNIRRFGEPDPPQEPIADYFDLWCRVNYGIALEWGLIPPAGGAGS